MNEWKERWSTVRLIPFVFGAIPYVLAVGFCVQAIYQMKIIFGLKADLASARSARIRRQETTTLMALRLVPLEAKDIAYASTQITVAWDPRLNRGLVAQQNLPTPPAGYNYQLWVLDPGASAPISAGLLNTHTGSEGFAVQPVSTPGPGFAISMEPTGGHSSPTGAILFAVAPSQ